MAMDINMASAEDLSAIEGISADAAQAIVTYREESGDYTSLTEITNVPGCNKHTMELLEAGGMSIGTPSSLEDAEGSHE